MHADARLRVSHWPYELDHVLFTSSAYCRDKIEPKDPQDPAVEALENVLHFNLAAAPPGAHTPRPTGGAKIEDLAEDPVGPRGAQELLCTASQLPHIMCSCQS